jgi:hypothetical protein
MKGTLRKDSKNKQAKGEKKTFDSFPLAKTTVSILCLQYRTFVNSFFHLIQDWILATK